MALLQAPPGAGKSTWLPLTLMREGHFKRIVMLEPRRLAARNIAQYLASQQNEKVGDSVGLRIRGESKVSSTTKLEIVTEGMLTRMLQNDPELSCSYLFLMSFTSAQLPQIRLWHLPSKHRRHFAMI